MNNVLKNIQEIINNTAKEAYQETNEEPIPQFGGAHKWPINCTVGPGLEGAIACESKIGYVNGAKGWLIYRGYNIFDLCANSTFEEVSYLLLHGNLPKQTELDQFKNKLFEYSHLNKTLRQLMGFPVEEMSAMGALRLGVDLMRQELTSYDRFDDRPTTIDAISSDEDSFAMETPPKGAKHATYEFKIRKSKPRHKRVFAREAALKSCCQLTAGVSTIIGAVSRIHNRCMPLEPRSDLSFAGNLLYMLTGKEPSLIEERMMDISLILHADHGMNASTFSTMVVASTLADIYFAVGSGIAALSGALHGGANEAVINDLRQIGTVENVKPWVSKRLSQKKRISGFGHRVYKVYDPRARVLGPLAELLVKEKPEFMHLYQVAKELEKTTMTAMDKEKNLFPNVDFYSGIIYTCLDIDDELFTPLFAASRVAGWTARVFEYIENNRIFRPRAIYTGDFDQTYKAIEKR